MSQFESESWARLRLVQGDSSAQVWELVASAGQTTLTVGSNPTCNWVVRERGVAPVHFSLHWDGGNLRIADTYGAGNVTVDEQPVTAQWRPLGGRARIAFGKAAIAVESSEGGVTVPGRFNEANEAATVPGRFPQQPSEVPVRQPMKTTLMGVSPMKGQQKAPAAPQPTPARPMAPSVPEPTPHGSFRPKRPSDTQRPHKPTLVGISSVPPPISARPGEEDELRQDPPASTPPEAAPAASAPSAVKPAPAPSAPSKSETRPQPNPPVAGRTLMGIGIHDALKPPPPGPRVSVSKAPPAAPPPVPSQAPAGRVGGASLAEGDQRTIQGFPAVSGSGPSVAPPNQGPGRRVTQEGMVSEAPGVAPGAVSRAPVRNVSAPPGPGEPIPQAVLTGHAGPSMRPNYEPSFAGPQDEPADRYSDPPPSGRPSMGFESRRPRAQFPWAYVGIAALTALAYFAWLYLLDHL